MRKNPFEKYLTQEDHLQHQVMEYLYYNYRNKCVFWHTDHTARKTPFERFKSRWVGIISGVPDIFILYQGKLTGIELKVIYASGKKNYPSARQKVFLKSLRSNGADSVVCWTFEQTKVTIDNIFKEER